MDISRTPPSYVLSKLKLFWKVILLVPPPAGTAIVGVSIILSNRFAGSGLKIAFGNDTATGVGVPELDVTHSGAPVIFTPCVATHPAGNAGATTPSKFSAKNVVLTKLPKINV